MSIFGGLGRGIIGQSLELNRSNTIAPSSQIFQNNQMQLQGQPQSTSQNQGNPNSLGFMFQLCQPPNNQVAQKSVTKQVECNPLLCCISGVPQFQNFCPIEIALNDKRLIKSGNVQPPRGNINTLSSGQTIVNQPQQGGFQAVSSTGGLFSAAAPTNTGLLFGATTMSTIPSTATIGGGLFGQTATPQGGSFQLGGQPPILQAPPFNNSVKKGGLFGQAPVTTGPSLFGMGGQTFGTGGITGMFTNTTATTTTNTPSPFQTGEGIGYNQQSQQGIRNSANEIIEEIRRIEQSKIFSEDKMKKKAENEYDLKNRSLATSKESVNHINYLKSQQQKRNIHQIYSSEHTGDTKFIEAPYNVKVNISTENVKRNEWQLLQRSQEIRNQPLFNIEQRILNPQQMQQQRLNGGSVMYNQLRQLERASFQEPRKSLAERDIEYKKEHLDSFSQTSYFKRLQQQVSQLGDEKQLPLSNISDSQLKENSISYLFEQSLKNSIKTFDTTVSIRIEEDQGCVIIPLQVKSSNTISYILTMVFDYIEERLNIRPDDLPIFKSNYVLYQPLEIDHLLQVRKDCLISDIETSKSGQIGHFEVVYLDKTEQNEVIGDDEMEEEDEPEEQQERREEEELSKLPIIPEGYEIEPSLQELRAKTTEQLRKFKNFKIRNEHAEICFEGEIDLNGRDFSKDLLITEHEIIIHPYRSADEPLVKPGYGINVQATIKRFKASQILMQNEKFDIQKIERRIRKLASDFNMQIVEPYNQNSDSFTVRVVHF